MFLYFIYIIAEERNSKWSWCRKVNLKRIRREESIYKWKLEQTFSAQPPHQVFVKLKTAAVLTRLKSFFRSISLFIFLRYWKMEECSCNFERVSNAFVGNRQNKSSSEENRRRRESKKQSHKTPNLLGPILLFVELLPYERLLASTSLGSRMVFCIFISLRKFSASFYVLYRYMYDIYRCCVFKPLKSIFPHY